MREKLKPVLVTMIFVLAVTSSGIISAMALGTWEVVGSAGFSGANARWVDVGIDEVTGTIYAAFQEGLLGSVSVMKFENFGSQTWEYVGTSQITGHTATHIALYMDSGTPLISFSDETPGVDGGLSVMEFDGANWNYVDSPGGISTYAVTFSSLLVDAGTIYVAYRESFTTLGLSNVEVSYFNGSSWQLYAGDPTVVAGSGAEDYIDLERHNGTTYVSYTENASGALSVISTTGSGWSPVGGFDISNGDGEYASMVIGGGVPYVAFSEGIGAVSVMRYDGPNWSYVDQAAISAGVSTHVSLDYYLGGPVVAYRDWGNNFRLSVQRYNGMNWEYVGDPGFTQDSVNFVSLAAGNAAYYVAVSDAGLSNAVTVVRYQLPSAIFADGFELGDTSMWSATVP
jgi:hypothetical protein